MLDKLINQLCEPFVWEAIVLRPVLYVPVEGARCGMGVLGYFSSFGAGSNDGKMLSVNLKSHLL